MTDKEYYVRGCTALLDAVGQAINKIDNVQKHLPEEHRAGKVLFVITTDGLENSSTEEKIHSGTPFPMPRHQFTVFLFLSMEEIRSGDRRDQKHRTRTKLLLMIQGKMILLMKRMVKTFRMFRTQYLMISLIKINRIREKKMIRKML